MFTEKPKGWFSRRHETSEAHQKAREAREAKQISKLQSARQRIEAAANRTPGEQLRRLDERLGVGVGARKERALLEKEVSND